MIIHIDTKAKTQSFLPLWKKLTTAGRAAEGLRDNWRRHLKEVRKEIGFEYIRFHGILHDDMMIYHEKEDGTPYYNWQYFDDLFDFLLEAGIRPILELGFMPSALASGDQKCFWWEGNVTPPKDYHKWGALIRELVVHSVNRYGLPEVLKWYFEVWNEANYPYFWGGTQEQYFELYRYSVNAIKSVAPRLKVGGPASSGFINDEAGWFKDFLVFCEKNSLPVDFVSAHPYPNDCPLDTDGKQLMVLFDEHRTCRDVAWIYDVVKSSPFKDVEIHLTEWNSSSSHRDMVHDTAFMAPFIIQNNIKCIGLADSLGFWTFTDVFEEGAAGDTPFHGGFGLINGQGLKKASYYGYWFLSRLGTEKLAAGDNYFVTKKNDSIQILLWNYCHYTDAFSSGDRSAMTEYDRYSNFIEKDVQIALSVEGLSGNYRMVRYCFGREEGSAYDAWLKNGTPASPTQEEIAILEKKTGPEATVSYLRNIGKMQQDILLSPHQVVLIELSPQV